MKTLSNTFKTLIILAFLIPSIAGKAQETLNAQFAYIFSWTNPYEILFFDLSQGTYDEFTWDVGDGTVYNQYTDGHIFSEDGTYLMTLTIGNSQTGATSSYQLSVTAPNVGCNNSITYEATGNPNEFSFGGVFPYAPTPINLTFEWDFGDGTTANGSSQLHTFPETGVDYEVSLTTKTWQGTDTCSFTTTIIVNSGTQADCFADFEYEVASEDGMTIQFENTSFTASGNDPSSVTWDFGDYYTSNELNPQHTYYDNGTYQVTLTIYDETTECSDVTYMQVVFDGNPPLRANFRYTFTTANTILILENTTGSITDYQWNMGDGTIINEAISTYEYTEDGQYYITLLVTDGATGQQAEYSLPVTIPQLGCNAYFSFESTGNTNEFEFRGSTPGFIQPWYEGYQWDFGDGSTAEGQQVTHTFDSSQGDAFEVTLTYWSTDFYAVDTCFFSISDTVFLELTAGADMVVSPDNPFEVQFMDASEGDPTWWMWDFGDGNTSMAKNPVHTFDAPGYYEIILSVYRENMPEDIVVIPYEVTSVSVEEINREQIIGSLSPNPNRGAFNLSIQSDSFEAVNVEVFNSMGALVYRNTFSSSASQISIDLGTAPAGVYQVVSSQGQNRTVNKMLVQ
jgi:PKD repeat protein